MTPAGTRVILYARCSTEEQAETGVSIESQEAILRRMAGQRDWHVVDFVFDVVSGSAESRPARERAIERIEAGEADALVANRLDRLSRSSVDFGTLAERARKNKWALVVLDPEVDMLTPAGELMASVLIAFAQFDQRMISVRTKEGLAAARAKGSQIGREKNVPDDVLKRIRDEYAAGKSFNSIATRLNRDGVPTAQGGAAWYASTVKYLITGEK